MRRGKRNSVPWKAVRMSQPKAAVQARTGGVLLHQGRLRCHEVYALARVQGADGWEERAVGVKVHHFGATDKAGHVSEVVPAHSPFSRQACLLQSSHRDMQGGVRRSTVQHMHTTWRMHHGERHSHGVH